MDATIQREQMLFDAALDLSDPVGRRAFLDEACAGEPDLRARIEGLLTAHVDADQFFAGCSPNLTALASHLPVSINEAQSSTQQALAEDKVRPSEEQPGTLIGRYRLLERLGEGGCGDVYMAEQEQPVRRRVALKVIKLGMDTRAVIARFEAERQALAMMDHPNIARVLDAGATETGRPYFVMDLVRGIKITEYCDQNHLDVRRRLDLFIRVCDAIQHAHQKGIIHRDIKPSNILVTIYDGVAVPKVIDFGVAKATAQQLTDKTPFTSFGQFIGTPAYMSPEQADTGNPDVDTRSDIYSLGVVLYELLTSHTPFDREELQQAGMDSMRRMLIEQEPKRPTIRLAAAGAGELTSVADCRRSEPGKLISAIRGDLDWIVMKALEKDRQRRYETANGLAMDIQRHLNHEPVNACPPSSLYRFQKLVRRNKLVFAAAGAVAAALIAGLGTSTWLFLKEREARQRAVAAEQQQAHLRHEAEQREKVTQATLFVSQNRFEEADVLAGAIPLTKPTLEGAAVLRSVGEWHALQQRWAEAAERLSALQQVNQLDGWNIRARDALQCAVVLAESGNANGLGRFQREAVARFAGAANPAVAEHIIKASLLLPADAGIIGQLERLAMVALPKPYASSRVQQPVLSGIFTFDGRSVEAEFSEPVDPAAALNPASYEVAGNTVMRLTPGDTPQSVVLWLASQLKGDFSVAVNGVKTRSQMPFSAGVERNTAIPLEIRNVGKVGTHSASFRGNLAVIETGGADIWQYADEFVFACAPIAGDFDYRLRIRSLAPVLDPFTRAGLMVRNSLSNSASHIMVAVNAENTFQVLVRTTSGGDTASFPPNPLPTANGSNSWVRLQRAGSVFHAYGSTNGLDWAQLYQSESATTGAGSRFSDPILFGIAACAHSSAETVTATVGDLGVTPTVSANTTLSLALLEYRKGNFASAGEWCRRCLAHPDRNSAQGVAARIIEAMSSHQLHDEDFARAQLASLRESVGKKHEAGLEAGDAGQGFWYDWIYARVLLREASMLVGLPLQSAGLQQ